MPTMLTITLALLNIAAVGAAAVMNPVEQATKALQMWILVGLSASLVVVVGYFLRGLHQDFRNLVTLVAHIDKTVTKHGETLKHHHELLERLHEKTE